MAAPATTPHPDQGLAVRTGGDGSFSLWSEAFGEGFHSGRGALREARETFLDPSQLERFPRGSTVRVLEVCVGTGCNLAVLLEACAASGLQLDWIGLELDPRPLSLALSQPAFRAPWQPWTLALLEELERRGEWPATPSPLEARIQPEAAPPPGASHDDFSRGPLSARSQGRMLWGDARRTLQQLGSQKPGRFDLIWHDAFSPQRCPQLWSIEFLRRLTNLLHHDGRWISYCSAAAVRESLRLAGLQLAALHTPQNAANHQQNWSGGTLASPSVLPPSGHWRDLTPMEREHLASSAGEPYRDPTATGEAEAIRTARQQAQAEALAQGNRGASSAWRRRWGMQR